MKTEQEVRLQLERWKAYTARMQECGPIPGTPYPFGYGYCAALEWLLFGLEPPVESVLRRQVGVGASPPEEPR